MNWFGAGREKLAEELRKASMYTRSLIEASLDPLVTISPEGIITDVNEATIKVTGVEEVYTEFEGTANCGYAFGVVCSPSAVRAGHIHASQAERRYLCLGRSESTVFHILLLLSFF